MAEDTNTTQPTDHAAPVDAHQALDDLTVLHQVASQSLGGAGLHVMGAATLQQGALHLLSTIQEGGTFAPLAVQHGVIQTGVTIAVNLDIASNNLPVIANPITLVANAGAGTVIAAGAPATVPIDFVAQNFGTINATVGNQTLPPVHAAALAPTIPVSFTAPPVEANAAGATTITHTVIAPNAPPTISGVVEVNTPATGVNGITTNATTLVGVENHGIQFQVAATDSNGAPLSITFTGEQHGTITYSAQTGDYTYTPDSTYAGSDHFTVTASDGHGASASQTITVDIVDPGPTSTALPDASVAEGHSATIATADHFSAPVDGATLTYTATGPDGAALPAGITIDPTTGTITATGTDADYGTHSITVTATDNNGVATSQTFTLTVTDPGPTSTALPDASVAEGHTTTITTADHFQVPVDGATLTYAATGPDGAALPAGITIDPATGQITATGTDADYGTHSITVTATDDHGVATHQTFTLNVTDPGPTAPDAQTVTGMEDHAITGSVGATPPVEGATLSYALEPNEGPAHGSITFDTSGHFTYTPTDDYSGTDHFEIKVTDDHGVSTMQTVTVDVEPDHAPVFTADSAGQFNHLGDTQGASQGGQQQARTGGASHGGFTQPTQGASQGGRQNVQAGGASHGGAQNGGQFNGNSGASHGGFTQPTQGASQGGQQNVQTGGASRGGAQNGGQFNGNSGASHGGFTQPTQGASQGGQQNVQTGGASHGGAQNGGQFNGNSGASHGGQYALGGSTDGQSQSSTGASQGGHMPYVIDGTAGNDSISAGDGTHVIYGMGGTDTISVGNGNDTIYANNGTTGTGQGTYEAQLHIAATSPDEAHGATMTYSVSGLPEHATLMYNGAPIDPSGLTDAQLQHGVYLSFPDNHVPAQSFDLSVTANLHETGIDGDVLHTQATLHVDPTAFMGGADHITAGNGSDTIWGGAGDNQITVGNGDDHIHVYDGNNTITAGNGHDTITVGNGDNTITLGSGHDTVTVGDGHNTITFAGGTGGSGGGYALGGTVTVSGGHDTVNLSDHAQVSIVDNAPTTGTEHLTINYTGADNAHETMLFDFGGHTGVAASGGDGWTHSLNIDLSHTSGQFVVTEGSHSWTVDHGTVTANTDHNTGQQGSEHAAIQTDGTVHVFAVDGNHEHEIAQFHHIDKITY